MGTLVVRNIDDEIIRALKEKAGHSGISAEAQHRLILTKELLSPNKKSFLEVLLSMPNVGKDSDFERQQQTKDIDVFD